MSEQRRATVMIIQRGDREIAGALMAGVMEGRAAAAARTSSDPASGATEGLTGPSSLETAHCAVSRAFAVPRGEGFWAADTHPAESLEIYTVEQDKWRRVARQVRIAVGNTKTPEDYCQLIVKARGDYAIHTRSGPLHTVAGKLLLAWALLWQGIWRAYDAQEKVLRP